MTNRRSFLATGLSGLSLSMLGGTASFAQTGRSTGKFVFVILRGAMDGLSAVVPYGDSAYRSLRGAIALAGPGEAGGVLPLTQGFGLHPSLRGLHGLWQDKQMSFMHAAASAYRDRSHFDGQDVLESGASRVYGAPTGWLNRAIALLPNGPTKEGIGIGRTIPLVLKGPAKAGSWAPAIAEQSDMDTLGRLMDLYANDTILGPALTMAIETDKTAAGGAMTASVQAGGGGARGAANYTPLTQAAARILSAPNGPAACVISLDGWDTHANQGGAQGQLANRLAGLDAAIVALKSGLGPMWASTTVVIATEFGRTARVNGTGGTDHGTGSAAFILGGAVKGQTMIGDWPGLSRLYQDRDLVPANDVRDLFRAGLVTAWRLDEAAINARVFGAA
jgi:uncharacterized protein (DUF1501 family)